MDDDLKARLVKLENVIEEVIKCDSISKLMDGFHEDGWLINMHFILTAIKANTNITEEDQEFLKEIGIKW